MKDMTGSPANKGKFIDPAITADGSARATVALDALRTLWVNTGTLCNIECANCYIESSPQNDALAYFRAADLARYLDEIRRDALPVEEIGFTGGEPFMNPEMAQMAGMALAAGHRVLILTNAMRPMMRPSVRRALTALHAEHPGRLTLRVSLDHPRRAVHDAERGAGTYDITLEGMRWIRDAGIPCHVAGRSLTEESEADTRAAFAALFDREGFRIDAANPAETVIFPEMDLAVEVPEITTACWGILHKSPSDVMCASSRMLVHRKGAPRPAVLACTLLAYDDAFELGETLADAARPVALNHPHCAKFCVLGGASCSA
ncbi:radical SAM protein [Pseudooceanicola sp. LIPI14-2-Ac024]|uniref:radical SAM protein n=1 Tax=Pseudooceanicola sp. LIPI14-2-Ac024 TaxID=3344875 RepID=UPI0035CFA768